ncbi:MAG: GTP-binding protein [Erysipelotrichia bacterium]|nr:GTP-binding protein [Erysipelotrichia bacterium]
MNNEIPIYLFTGFLESGKTSFILENLHNPGFASGEKTLVIACEDGEIPYDKTDDALQDVDIVYLDDENKFTHAYCQQLETVYEPERIMIEYNGMWQLNTLYQEIPENWLIAQQITVIDASTFIAYNNMFRNLMVEKLAGSEFILFNRVSYGDDKMQFHKIVRAITRKAEIAYEYIDGKGEYDDIVDPLPFDLNAPVVNIEFRDYALWIQDVIEEYQKYVGKKLCLTAKAVYNSKIKNGFSFGRKVMTCCIADIKFMGLICENHTKEEIKLPGWYEIEAEMAYGYQAAFKRKVPYLKAYRITKAKQPENEVATFY